MMMMLFYCHLKNACMWVAEEEWPSFFGRQQRAEEEASLSSYFISCIFPSQVWWLNRCCPFFFSSFGGNKILSFPRLHDIVRRGEKEIPLTKSIVLAPRPSIPRPLLYVVSCPPPPPPWLAAREGEARTAERKKKDDIASSKMIRRMYRSPKKCVCAKARRDEMTSC